MGHSSTLKGKNVSPLNGKKCPWMLWIFNIFHIFLKIPILNSKQCPLIPFDAPKNSPSSNLFKSMSTTPNKYNLHFHLIHLHLHPLLKPSIFFKKRTHSFATHPIECFISYSCFSSLYQSFHAFIHFVSLPKRVRY